MRPPKSSNPAMKQRKELCSEPSFGSYPSQIDALQPSKAVGSFVKSNEVQQELQGRVRGLGGRELGGVWVFRVRVLDSGFRGLGFRI